MIDRPNQIYGVGEVARLRAAGARRICLTSPTGGGKTLMAIRMAERELAAGGRAVFYSNRSILTEKTFEDFAAAGLGFGAQVSGYASDPLSDLQVASIQTVATRVASGAMDLFDATLVLVDEAHEERRKRAEIVLHEHLRRGATLVGMTATPLNLGGHYDELVVAGTYSELRAQGALIPADTYAPDEPSMKAFKPKQAGVLQLKDEVKQVMLPRVFGRVLSHAQRYNPERKPAVLFAQDVACSLWFAQQFWARGFPAAHIDHKIIWINGETMVADDKNRRRLRAASESGEVWITCNRFVLRVGVDWPHLWHGICTCTFGSVGPYIQTGGRLARQFFVSGAPQYDRFIWQDHGGNYWRHDSLNADRVWKLGDTERSVAQEREQAFRTKAQAEPWVCPSCGKVRYTGVQCQRCGHIAKQRTRRVIETSGQLRVVTGDVHAPPRVAKPTPELHKAWEQCVFRTRHRKVGGTFAAARGLFMRENGYQVPGPDFPYYPREERQWYQEIKDVSLRDIKEPLPEQQEAR